jgi:hypothetical protein
MAFIQSLWLGERLSPLEALSIQSFLAHGYEFHLYCYNDVKNIPSGVTIRDGRDILGPEWIFCYQRGLGKGSYSAFSNFFRYRMLLVNGGWWSDLDMVCIRPFDLNSDYVFSSEHSFQMQDGIVNCGVIKAPPSSEIMNYCWEYCLQQKKEELEWGAIGPRLIDSAVRRFNLHTHVQPITAFCAVSYVEAFRLVEANIEWDWSETALPTQRARTVEQAKRSGTFPSHIYGVHLWNEIWRRECIDKFKKYPESSLFEQLKLRYGVECDARQIQS